MTEFSRPFALDTIGSTSRNVAIEANPAERAALAARFDLIAVDALSARASLVQGVDGPVATGQLLATVIQRCVATAGPVTAALDEPFTIRFVADQTQGEGEIELDSADCDTMPHDSRVIDLGEAVAQSLVLALDPFPRAADADAVLARAGVVREDDYATGPFASLKGLIGKS
jgi:uncharacterized metal-binding protein YceD (DUF177 family)